MPSRELAVIIDYFSFASTLQFQRTKILLFPYSRGHLPAFPSLTRQFLTNVFAPSQNISLLKGALFPCMYAAQICFLWGLPFMQFQKNFSTQIDILLSNQFLIQTEMRFLLRC